MKKNKMDHSWDNLEPSPIEFFHGLLMDKFHEFRRKRTENITVEINGMELNQIIADCKRETYKKYEVLNLKNAIPKSVLQGTEVPSTGFGLEDLKRGVCIKDKYEAEGKSVIIIGCESDFKRPRPEEFTIEMIPPKIESYHSFKQKRTTHEGQPANYGKGTNIRMKGSGNEKYYSEESGSIMVIL